MSCSPAMVTCTSDAAFTFQIEWESTQSTASTMTQRSVASTVAREPSGGPKLYQTEATIKVCNTAVAFQIEWESTASSITQQSFAPIGALYQTEPHPHKRQPENNVCNDRESNNSHDDASLLSIRRYEDSKS